MLRFALQPPKLEGGDAGDRCRGRAGIGIGQRAQVRLQLVGAGLPAMCINQWARARDLGLLLRWGLQRRFFCGCAFSSRSFCSGTLVGAVHGGLNRRCIVFGGIARRRSAGRAFRRRHRGGCLRLIGQRGRHYFDAFVQSTIGENHGIGAHLLADAGQRATHVLRQKSFHLHRLYLLLPDSCRNRNFLVVRDLLVGEHPQPADGEAHKAAQGGAQRCRHQQHRRPACHFLILRCAQQ